MRRRNMAENNSVLEELGLNSPKTNTTTTRPRKSTPRESLKPTRMSSRQVPKKTYTEESDDRPTRTKRKHSPSKKAQLPSKKQRSPYEKKTNIAQRPIDARQVQYPCCGQYYKLTMEGNYKRHTCRHGDRVIMIPQATPSQMQRIVELIRRGAVNQSS